MIISAQSIHVIEHAVLTPDALYERMESLISDLAAVHPRLTGWHDFPRSRKDVSAPFIDRNAIVERMAAEAAKDEQEYKALKGAGGGNLSLTTSENDSEWRKPGVATLVYQPVLQQARFTIKQPESVFGDVLPTVMRDVLAVMVRHLSPKFAKTDVKARGADRQIILYQIDRRLYQHRDFIGWMGYVPVKITHDRLRDAYETIPAGKGTIIVSVPGVFDPTDDAQVDKVHRVEMDLASYDLLEVLDPNLKE